MSDRIAKARPRHPVDKNLTEALEDDKDRIKARKGIIDKKATLIKAPDDESDACGDVGGTMTPTPEQLDEINKFTRRAVTAEEVVAFSTLSCNDIVDRDDDQFSAQCVQDFAALEHPYSPVGKSYMLDHNYSVGNAIGRIFGVDTKKVSGALFLTNDVYVPKTEKNQSFIEDLDFGINWAVSVGVMLGKDECTVCAEPFSSWGWWCRNGHDKGASYDPKSDETDEYGYPLACDPEQKGAVKCVRKFSEPKDFYELSQVFLGAQYYAELEKRPDFAGVMKSVAKGVPTIGLSADEAKELPIRHEPQKVSEARRLYGVKEIDDGSIAWTDAQGLRWTFDPETPSDGVMSLGKANNNQEEEDGEHSVSDGLGSDDSDESNVSVSDAGSGNGGTDDHSAPDGSEHGSESGQVDNEDDDSREKSVSKASVLSEAEKAKLPNKVIDAAKGASDNGLSALLLAASSEIEGLRKEVTDLTTKAGLGDLYVKELRAEAIGWYVKSHQSAETPKVSTTTFERLLDKCGDDVELLKAMSDEQAQIAKERFPKSVKRASFPSDPNSAESLKDVNFGEGGDDNDSRVKRIHG